jgi:hypothetical protein
MATKQQTQQETVPHVAIVPTPGIGHLIPLVEVAKRLVVHHNFLVTILIPTDGSPVKPQKAILEALPNSISSIFLPPASLDDLPEDVLAETPDRTHHDSFPPCPTRLFQGLGRVNSASGLGG